MVAGREKKVKHEQIYETIFNRILSQEYSPGEKMPNEHQLADSFNASRPTIGKALQKLEKNGLIQRKPGAGTFVKQADPSRGQKLGILVPRLSVEPGDFHHFVSLFSVVVSQISRTANHYEHMLLMNDLPSGNDQEIIDHAWTICHQLIGIQVKGVFFLPLELPPKYMHVNAEIAETLDNAGIAVTLLDRDIHEGPQRSKFDLVGINNERSADILTQHLIDSGCQKIDFVSSPAHASAINDRIRGYQNALIRNGIPPEKERVHHFAVKPLDSRDVSIDKEAARKLMSETDTEALVCVNDRIAGLIMRQVLDMGLKIPENIRIVGFDDEPLCSYLPVSLTTMRQPAQAIGAEAVRTMVSRIKEPDMPPRDIMLGTELVIRNSCGSNHSALKK